VRLQLIQPAGVPTPFHVKSREFIGVQRLKPLKRYGNGWTSGTPEGVP